MLVFVLQMDIFHRFEEQGPKFERLHIDIEHLDLGEYFLSGTTTKRVLKLVIM